MNLYKFYFVVFFIGQFALAKGQHFIISGMATFTGISSNATSINFKSNANCIDVQSGVAVLKNTINLGQFVINCKENQQFNQLGLRMFPIPVVANAKIRFTNTPPLTEKFTLSIWDIEGRLMMDRTETGYQIYQGLTLNLTYLIPGNYVFKITSSQYVDAIKFVKVK